METVSIYGLVDPRTDGVRYVGKTVRNLHRRLSCHISDAKTTLKISHKDNWIRSLLNDNIRPSITLLEEAPLEDWEWYEMWWIKYGRVMGWRLTNATSGGEGLHSPSEETSARIGKSSKQRNRGENNPFWGKSHSIESKHRMSDSLRGRPSTMLGKKHTEESKQKISEAQKNRSLEVTEKIRASQIKNGKLKGERNPSAILTEKEVSVIKRRLLEGENQTSLSMEYNVSNRTINAINCNKIWKHI